MDFLPFRPPVSLSFSVSVSDYVSSSGYFIPQSLWISVKIRSPNPHLVW
ncbi:hypothetical protein CLOSTASPAR_02715 [[Clostridium] asparagiforme DSM 15981]|uniref:Uncharacterized protein n=1 Tax=[Clostridium] asparagiforme DSM 15981 TaxID=518636 RepID=C0D0D2_9FIRM|nr:hypothetical protein CLOSTASPAR_02715 [[Clostridium] asparagiforme DSM 15981]